MFHGWRVFFLLKIEDAFDVPSEYKKVFEGVIRPKLEKGERVNVFFSSNFFNFNYYYLTQFVFLSTLAKSSNVFFYITLADTVLFAKKHVHFSSPMAAREGSTIQANVEEIKRILCALGISEKNIFVVKSSEAWLRFVKFDENSIIEFYKSLSLFPNSALNIPNWWIERYYVPKNTKFSLSYAVEKYIDLFACKYFERIFPEEIQGKIDLFVTGNAGSRLLLVAKDTLVEEGLLSKDWPVLVMKGIPCFGHTNSINPKFCMPSIDMNVQEIYSIIKQYNVSHKHVKELFDNLLSKVLDEFIIIGQKNVIEKTSSLNISKYSLEKQRLILAYNLEAYLKKLKSKIQDKQDVKYYSIDKKNQMIEISNTLRSELTLDILHLCDGNNTITEIAKKLGKHTSNVSAILSKLKEKELVSVNKEGKPIRTITSVKFNF